ncbi:hypothetical protein AB0J43_53095, partial [Nonomuraea fuscirosea]
EERGRPQRLEEPGIAETVRRLLLRPGVHLLPPPRGRVERSLGIFPDAFVLGTGAKEQEGR